MHIYMLGGDIIMVPYYYHIDYPRPKKYSVSTSQIGGEEGTVVVLDACGTLPPSLSLPSLPSSSLSPSLPPSFSPQVHEDEIDKQLWGELESKEEEEEEVGHVTPDDVIYSQYYLFVVYISQCLALYTHCTI